MKKDFQGVTARDKQAAAYFASDAFLEAMKEAAQRHLVNFGDNHARLCPKINPKPQDLPLIQQAFLKVKEEYPELDHVHMQVNNGRLILDTKKNTLHRRFRLSL